MRPHVMKAAPMLVLSVIAMCSQVQGEAVATGAGVLRGNHDVEQSHNAQIASNVVRRRLEDEDANEANDGDNDGDNDEAANNDENEYYKYDDDANGWQEVEQETQDTQTNSTMDIFVSKVQSYKANAESTAWEFYESPPSQWTTHQWDLVFALSCGILATCCLSAACCAYNCVKEDAVDDAELLPLSPKAREWTPRAYRSPSSLSTDKRKGKNISSHRNEFSRAQYKRYQEEQENGATDDDATVDTEMDGGQPPSASQTPCYSPPSSPAVTTTSLADYTSVQREKEGRIFEAWKAEQSPKKTNSSNNNYDSNNNQPAAAANSRTKKSVVELDAALAGANKNKKEDKLLEARERQHNLVGYYL